MLLSMGYSDESPACTTQCDFRRVRDAPSGVWLWHLTTFGCWTMKEDASAQRIVDCCNECRSKGLEAVLNSASLLKR